MQTKDWASMATGESGDINLEMAVLRGLQGMYETFVRKNHDYGPNNISAGGPIGLALRLGDKVSRLWNLTGINGDGRVLVGDEAMEDTGLDIANYGLYLYLMATGQWPEGSIDENLNARQFLALQMCQMDQADLKYLMRVAVDLLPDAV